MWSTILIVTCYNNIFVMSELVNEKGDVNRASNDTIQEIKQKIDKIANTVLAHSSVNNRSNVLDNLEKKMLWIAGNLGPREGKYVQLIMEQIKSKVLNRIDDNKTTTIQAVNQEAGGNKHNGYKLVTEVVSEIDSFKESGLNKLITSKNKESVINLNKNKLMELVTSKQNELRTKEEHLNISRRIFKPDNERSFGKSSSVDKIVVKSDIFVNYKTSKGYKHPRTPPADCHEFVNRICVDVKKMNRLKCLYDNSYIDINKLCDGTPDCSYKSDERNCYPQAMEKFLYIKQIVASMEATIYSNCFEYNIRKSVLSNQAKELQDVLNKIYFRMKFTPLNLLNKSNIAGGDDTNNKINSEPEANNIALIISSLTFALDGALCSSKLSFDTRRTNNLFDIDLKNKFMEAVGSPESCKCNENVNEFCTNCTYYCKRLCRQKYSLFNWNCESLNGTDTVSLNLVCDGKFDCFDESDEKGCATGLDNEQLEAREIFNDILNILQWKSSNVRQPIRQNFLLLSNSVMKLQELAVNPVTNREALKKLRDKSYLMLSSIYSDIVNQYDIGKEPEEAYSFLLSINQNLGTALKRSHTGNSKVMESGCHCKNGKCTAPFCSKICVRACVVEPKLTRYYCGRTDKFVAVVKICDGKQDCKNGEDEMNCKADEICRHHHMAVLRKNLEVIGENLKGTALGERLSSWKLKVISTVKIVENNERTTPQVLKKVVKDSIKDLAVTYGSVEKYKRADYAFGVFLDISQIVWESLKLCRN